MFFKAASRRPRALSLTATALLACQGHAERHNEDDGARVQTARDEPERHEHGAVAPDAQPHDEPAEHGHHEHHNSGPTPRADHHGHGHHKHHRFEDAEAWAEQFDSPERAAWQKPDVVIASLGLAPDTVVADLGAGTGYFAERFARALPKGHVYAQDLEPDMVRYLEERARKAGLNNLTAVRGAADDAALPDAVDLVFLCDVYHHVNAPAAYFKKLRASLRPGGRVVVVDFKPDAPEDAPGPPPPMRVAPEDVIERFAAAGYAVRRRDMDLLPYQYVLEFSAVETAEPPDAP